MEVRVRITVRVRVRKHASDGRQFIAALAHAVFIHITLPRHISHSCLHGFELLLLCINLGKQCADVCVTFADLGWR